MLRSLLLSALLIGLLPPLTSYGDVVHLRGAAAVDGEVEVAGDVVRVARDDSSDPVVLPRSRVLFIEPERDLEVRKAHSEIRGLLHDVGSRHLDQRLEAHHRLKQYPAGLLFRPLVRSLLHSRAQVRHFAAFQLGELGSSEALDELVKVSLKDKDQGVRDAAFAAASKIGHPALFHPYAKALFSSSEGIRIRAAKALGALGDIRGIEYLIKRYSISGGSGARSSISSLDSQSYIRDFDVEVAQAAVIADPIVGIARSGAVLDSKVVGIHGTMTAIEKRVISESLEDLTGRRFGANPGAWKSWWKKEKKEFLETARARQE